MKTYKSAFIDTNVLIRADTAEAPLHKEAAAAVQRLRDEDIEIWINRQVLREFLSTLTRPQTFISTPPLAAVLARIRFFQSQFYIAEDNSLVTEKLLALMETISIGGKQVHDANIVATMQAYGIQQLLTNNVEDFMRFSGFITIIPVVKG